MKRSPAAHYLAEREQLTVAHLLLSGYAPLAFLVRHLVQLLAPIAMLLGISDPLLEMMQRLDRGGGDPAAPPVPGGPL